MLYTSSRIFYAISLTENWTDLVLRIFLLKNTCKLSLQISEACGLDSESDHAEKDKLWNLNVFFN